MNKYIGRRIRKTSSKRVDINQKYVINTGEYFEALKHIITFFVESN